MPFNLGHDNFRQPIDRRHSHDAGAVATPPLSRSNSVSSIASHKSEPSGFTSLYTGTDRTRGSVASTSSQESQKGGFKGIFSHLSKSDKPKEKQNVEHLIIHSKYAAAANTRRILMNPKHVQELKDRGILISTHQDPHSLSSAQQEYRRPHSGPPALKAKAAKMEMPVLTKIISGDERDEEEELERARHEWLMSKIPAIDIDDVPEQAGAEEIAEGDTVDTTTIDNHGHRLIGAEIRSRPHTPKPQVPKPTGMAWHRDEKGNWKR